MDEPEAGNTANCDVDASQVVSVKFEPLGKQVIAELDVVAGLQ